MHAFLISVLILTAEPICSRKLLQRKLLPNF